jgi:hypothetical protein
VVSSSCAVATATSWAKDLDPVAAMPMVLGNWRIYISSDTTRLVLELQTIARDAGHPVPLLIAMDQENGGVNSLYVSSAAMNASVTVQDAIDEGPF